jgi:hypothetical protein
MVAAGGVAITGDLDLSYGPAGMSRREVIAVGFFAHCEQVTKV